MVKSKLMLFSLRIREAKCCMMLCNFLHVHRSDDEMKPSVRSKDKKKLKREKRKLVGGKKVSWREANTFFFFGSLLK